MRTLLLWIILPFTSPAQQVADTGYHPPVPNPVYSTGKGPVVFIDEGHHNFHTKTGRYLSFSNLLERDGYRVLEYEGDFTNEKLSEGKILVISNALNEINVENWFLPTPSAFTKTEMAVVNEWVKHGGSLFLIADHMPMAGAAKELAAEFGFEFTNGFVFHEINEGTAIFNLKEGSLIESSITTGRHEKEKIDHVVTFTGQGFKIPDDAKSILTFGEQYKNLLPDTAWVFTPSTPEHTVQGWSQGAFKKSGKGRVVVFGEAAKFTAQLAGPEKRKVGMNNEKAGENFQLLLNIIHWLDGKLD